MIQRIVDVLLSKQSQNHILTEEDEKIYRYGYTLLCEVFLNFIIALIIGIVFSRIKEVIFFLCMYIPLRSFCGGWHANEIVIMLIIRFFNIHELIFSLMFVYIIQNTMLISEKGKEKLKK